MRRAAPVDYTVLVLPAAASLCLEGPVHPSIHSTNCSGRGRTNVFRDSQGHPYYYLLKFQFKGMWAFLCDSTGADAAVQPRGSRPSVRPKKVPPFACLFRPRSSLKPQCFPPLTKTVPYKTACCSSLWSGKPSPPPNCSPCRCRLRVTRVVAQNMPCLVASAAASKAGYRRPLCALASTRTGPRLSSIPSAVFRAAVSRSLLPFVLFLWPCSLSLSP